MRLHYFFILKEFNLIYYLKKEKNISNGKLKKIIQNINYGARHERLKWDWDRKDANF